MISPQEFKLQYEKYFGPAALLPIVVGYSDTALGNIQKTHGCIFKVFNRILEGENIALDEKSINCMGGKFYTGMREAPPQIYDFVSGKEKYKITPECVRQSVEEMNIVPASSSFLNFMRLDKASSFENAIGLIFLATPDVLSGLFAWANYDQNDINAVESPWGSGCFQTISVLATENGKGGKHCYIGTLDISARPYFPPEILSFSIPMSRFAEMCQTFSQCCVGGSPAWEKLRSRIDSEPACQENVN